MKRPDRQLEKVVSGASASSLRTLLQEVRTCTLCANELPLGPRPVLQAGASARILIAGQAPGRKVHESGKPFDDASGERLRAWLGIDRGAFYDADAVAILPMGFCFPGTGAAGDLPPRPECAATWRARLLVALERVELTIILGRYALAYHLPDYRRATLTEAVGAWREQLPVRIVLPHPSPRNQRWVRQNPWFEADLLPDVRARVAAVLSRSTGAAQR